MWSSIDWLRSRRAGVVLLGLLAAACANKPSPPAPKEVALAEYKYLIGPGDTLSVIVWRNPDLSMSVPVRPDGNISLPLGGGLAGSREGSRGSGAARSNARCPSTFGTPW